MKYSQLSLIFCAFACMAFSLAPESSIDLNISINNLRNSEGNIKVHVYSNQEDFTNKTPDYEYFFNKTENGGKSFKVSIPLNPGNYGIAILDDENMSGEMDYTFLGFPEEGYGFSKFEHTGLSRPSYKDFEFTLDHGLNESLQIKLRYM